MEPIKIWRFGDEPKEVTEHIVDHDDADWVALVPPGYKDDYIGFLQEGGPFGCCCVSEYEFGDSIIYVGHHS